MPQRGAQSSGGAGTARAAATFHRQTRRCTPRLCQQRLPRTGREASNAALALRKLVPLGLQLQVAVKLVRIEDVDERSLDCLRREVAVLLHTVGECKQVRQRRQLYAQAARMKIQLVCLWRFIFCLHATSIKQL